MIQGPLSGKTLISMMFILLPAVTAQSILSPQNLSEAKKSLGFFLSAQEMALQKNLDLI